MKVMGMALVWSSAERWRAMASALLRAQPSVTPSQAMAAALRKGILQETRLPAWRTLASREKRLALETGGQSALRPAQIRLRAQQEQRSPAAAWRLPLSGLEEFRRSAQPE